MMMDLLIFILSLNSPSILDQVVCFTETQLSKVRTYWISTCTVSTLIEQLQFFKFNTHLIAPNVFSDSCKCVQQLYEDVCLLEMSAL